jgi:ATP-binding cassette subfamily B protein
MLIFLSCLISSRLLVAVFEAIRSHLRFLLGRKLSFAMEDALIDKKLSFPIEVNESPDFLDKQSRAQQRAQSLPTQILDTTLRLAQDVVTLLGTLIALATLSPILPLLGVLSSSFHMSINRRISKEQYSLNKNRTQRVRRERYLKQLLSGKQNMTHNLFFGLAPLFRTQYEEHRDITISEDVNLDRWRWKNTWIGHVLSSLVYCCSYLFVAYLVVKSAGTYGMMVMFLSLYAQTEGAFRRIGNSLVSFYEKKLFMEDYFEIVDMNKSRAVYSGSRKILSDIYTISFENVSFHYPGCEKYVLKDIDFTLSKGEVMCLVGLNGAGKTSLLNLLTRLYQPTQGRILVNGENLNEFNEKEFYEKYGVVTQVLPSYYFSIRDNVRFGHYWHKESENGSFTKACRLFGIDKIAEKFPLGYETKLGRIFDEGVELSYGQWKRLALARVAYKEAAILIYDEPTAGIDPITEEEIINQILSQKQNKSILIASHRMAVAKNSDNIILLNDGKILEQGNHEDLMAMNGMYSKLFNLQVQRYAMDSD